MPNSLSLATLAAFGALLTAACSDSTAPATVTLAAVTPTPAAANVSASTQITLTFSHSMMAGMEQFVDLHQGSIAGPVMPMTCGWSAGQTVLTCTPASPLSAATTYCIHVGAGMTDAQRHMITMDGWTTMGGQWATSGMIGATHAGQPVGMMGTGWRQGAHYGMLFPFTTA